LTSFSLTRDLGLSCSNPFVGVHRSSPDNSNVAGELLLDTSSNVSPVQYRWATEDTFELAPVSTTSITDTVVPSALIDSSTLPSLEVQPSLENLDSSCETNSVPGDNTEAGSGVPSGDVDLGISDVDFSEFLNFVGL
jgi:hypothetical protein